MSMVVLRVSSFITDSGIHSLNIYSNSTSKLVLKLRKIHSHNGYHNVFGACICLETHAHIHLLMDRQADTDVCIH